jgi:hypothetical protein
VLLALEQLEEAANTALQRIGAGRRESNPRMQLGKQAFAVDIKREFEIFAPFLHRRFR